jgi:hypothetical protein
VILTQFPAGAVVRDFEIMGDPQMPAKHLSAIPALEADHMIGLYRASDRNCRLGRPHRRRAAAEIGETPMHLDDERWNLIGRDLIMPDIAANDFRDLNEINLWL